MEELAKVVNKNSLENGLFHRVNSKASNCIVDNKNLTRSCSYFFIYFVIIFLLNICTSPATGNYLNKQEKIIIDSSVNIITPSKVIYLENMLIFSSSVKYEVNYKIKDNLKINYGLGIGTHIPLWMPFSVSIPLEFYHSFGKVQQLMIGWMILPTYWFSKNFSEVDFLGFGSTTYYKNNFNLAAFFRFGYKVQTEDIFLKVSIGPALGELATDRRLWSYSAFYDNELDILFLFMPAIGIGKVF